MAPSTQAGQFSDSTRSESRDTELNANETISQAMIKYIYDLRGVVGRLRQLKLKLEQREQRQNTAFKNAFRSIEGINSFQDLVLYCQNLMEMTERNNGRIENQDGTALTIQELNDLVEGRNKINEQITEMQNKLTLFESFDQQYKEKETQIERR